MQISSYFCSCRVKQYLFGDSSDAVQDSGENTSHVAVSVVTIPQQGWKNLKYFSEIAGLDFTMSSILAFFCIARR